MLVSEKGVVTSSNTEGTSGNLVVLIAEVALHKEVQ